MTRTLRFSIFVLFACLLAGCIVVEDFGDYWDKGDVDVCVNDILISSMKADNVSPQELDAMELRRLTLGTHTFLMMREHRGDKGGNLIRYAIRDGHYISYRLKDAKRDDFLRYFPGSGVVLTPETATITLLDDASAGLLQTIASDDSYWLEDKAEPYNPTQRKDCIQPAK